MELFHIHLLGNKDNKYKEGSILNIDPTEYNNRLYNRIHNANVTVENKEFKRLVENLNLELEKRRCPIFRDRINLGELISYILINDCSPSESDKILKAAKEMLLDTGTNYRELAMEECRKEFFPDKPSRLHSLFACSEEGLDYWISQLYDGDSDVYLIDVEDEPFRSNACLLPDENLSYGMKVQAARRYFSPRLKDLDEETDEYLVQGRVRLLDKVGVVRFNK